jgi:hypothetical protein
VTRRRIVILTLGAAVAITASGALLASPPAARAFNPIKPICTVAGLLNGVAQKACSVAGQVAGGAASTATTALTVAAVVTWAVGGARFLLHETSDVLAKTTAPQLTSTWFSSTYWRVAGIAAVLTLPFLFAAAIQALLRSDLSLLIRAALGYLPLAVLAVAIAAPLTMLLLAASDQLSAIVSSAAGNQSAHFLDRSAGLMGSISALVSSSFVGFLVALFTAAGAIVLWMELLVREASVYVIVLMLPLAFAAFVWPARRIWAIRSVELLIALILSKFAIVAVLSLGGAALAQSANRSVTGLLAGAVLMALAAFAPWAMLRVVPLTEIASGAAGSLGGGASTAFHALQGADAWTSAADHWASKTAQMRRTAESDDGADAADGGDGTDGATAARDGFVANVGAQGGDAGVGGDPRAKIEGGGMGAGADGSDVGAGADLSEAQPSGRPAAAADKAATDATDGAGNGNPSHVTPADSSSHAVTDLSVPAGTPVLDLEDPPPLDHRCRAPEGDQRADEGHAADLTEPTPAPQPETEPRA